MAEEQARERNGITDAKAGKLKAETAKAEAGKERLLAEATKLLADAEKAKSETKRIDAEAVTTEADREKLKAEAAKLLADAEKARAESKMIEAEAEKAQAEKERLQAEARRIEAEAATSELEKGRLKAETKKYDADVKKIEADKERIAEQRELAKADTEKMEEHAKASTGVRDFVRDSLLDIMAGVDDAAAVGKTRDLTEGLVGYLPSVTAIGAAASGDHQAERVEFDLAVTVVVAEKEAGSDKLAGELKIAPMFFPVSGGLSGRIERNRELSHSSEFANRIRFSVPIVYATQNDPLDYE